MRTSMILGFAAASVLAACGSSSPGTSGDDAVTCGVGTTLVDGACTPDGTGGDTCGSGTHLVGTVCIGDGSGSGSGSAGAPTITMMDPSDAGFTGNGSFQITGTNFSGDGISGLTVAFGQDGSGSDCTAVAAASSPTTIVGTVPPLCANFDVNVTVTTNNGSASTPFHYDALFAADGDGGGNIGVGGELWAIDPEAVVSADLGPIIDADDTDYSISGLAFDATGVLWGVTDGLSDGDVDGTSTLVTIGFDGTVTPVGDVSDAGGDQYYVSDIKFYNGTLYGWANIYDPDAAGSFDTQLVTISTADGTVTTIGDSSPLAYTTARTDANEDQLLTISGGMAFDGMGNLNVAADGAAPSANLEDSLNADGNYVSVNTTTGVQTIVTQLDWQEAAPINSMDYVLGELCAVIDDGTYGFITSEPIDGAATADVWFGETLAYIDPAAASGTVVNDLFALPARATYQSQVDGIAFLPTFAPATTRKVPFKYGALTQLHHVTKATKSTAAASHGHSAKAAAFVKAAMAKRAAR